MINKAIIIPIIALIFLLIDFYVFQAVRVASHSLSPTLQRGIHWIYWSITVITLLGFFVYHFVNPDSLGRIPRTFIMVGIFINYFSKLFVIFFLLIDDLIRLGKYFINLLYARSPDSEIPVPDSQNAISRSEFLMKTAVIAGSIPVIGATYGIVSGAHDYRVRRVKVTLPNLPSSFHGLKIAQISDIHSGSFFNKTAVKGGVEMLLGEKPDVVFFTGDLVNNVATEVNSYLDIFNKVKAPMGVYSILGNHDYGDYVQWESAQAKKNNLENLAEAHRALGWDLLVDEHRFLQQGANKIAIIGIQNWGAKGRFPKYGNLAKASKGTNEAEVKLLLSHDPSHWDAQVRTQHADIDIMFAGHTHGMQFGVEIAGIKWSPVQYMYEQWAGLYQQPNAEGKNQYLYVNRGFGYLGFPGRIGMPPEITIMELLKA